MVLLIFLGSVLEIKTVPVSKKEALRTIEPERLIPPLPTAIYAILSL
jgi:hypothetical protein